MKKCIFIMLVLWSAMGKGQDNQDNFTSYSMPNSEIRNLESKINGVSYSLYISYPQDYAKDTLRKYDVLYLLDADYSFAIAKNVVTHLSERGHLDNLIIVGVAYNNSLGYRINRTRDYTPRNVKNSTAYKEIHEKYSGGGDLFKEFIANELFPFMDREYRATKKRVLTGHSYGGLFASWILSTNPDLFNGYIIISPSLWYDEGFLLKFPTPVNRYNGRRIKAYFAVGEREINDQWNMPKDLNEFVNNRLNQNSDYLEIRCEVAADETHNSIFPRALSNGIRFVFDGI